MLYSCQLNFECARYALEKPKVPQSSRRVSEQLRCHCATCIVCHARDILSLPLRSCAEAGGWRFAKGAGHERTTLTLRDALRESCLHLDCAPSGSAPFSSVER